MSCNTKIMTLWLGVLCTLLCGACAEPTKNAGTCKGEDCPVACRGPECRDRVAVACGESQACFYVDAESRPVEIVLDRDIDFDGTMDNAVTSQTSHLCPKDPEFACLDLCIARNHCAEGQACSAFAFDVTPVAGMPEINADTGFCTDASVAGVQMEVHQTYLEDPGIVSALVDIKDNLTPLTGLDASDFEIREDGLSLPASESNSAVRAVDYQTSQFVTILLDFSGSIHDSAHYSTLLHAAREFALSVVSTHQVAAYLFDGRDVFHGFELTFTTSSDEIDAFFTDAQYESPEDPSTNLYGSVINGIDILTDFASTMTSALTLQRGALVVFTDGHDSANRASLAEAQKAITATEFTVYAVAVSTGATSDLDRESLMALSSDHYYEAANYESLIDVFAALSSEFRAEDRALYLVSYCTPARGGEHTMGISLVDYLSVSVSISFEGEPQWGIGCNAANARPDLISPP